MPGKEGRYGSAAGGFKPPLLEGAPLCLADDYRTFVADPSNTAGVPRPLQRADAAGSGLILRLRGSGSANADAGSEQATDRRGKGARSWLVFLVLNFICVIPFLLSLRLSCFTPF